MKILFFDTETTGLPIDPKAHWTKKDNWPRLVQLGWLVYDEDGRETEAAQMTIKPEGFEIPEAATLIHGITTEHAKKLGFKADYVLRKFEEKVRKADLIVCHHARFDVPVVRAEFWRMGEMSGISDAKTFCTKENAAPILGIPNERPEVFAGEWKWPSLEETYRFCFDEPIPGRHATHSALTDARATAKIFFHLFNPVTV